MESVDRAYWAREQVQMGPADVVLRNLVCHPQITIEFIFFNTLRNDVTIYEFWWMRNKHGPCSSISNPPM